MCVCMCMHVHICMCIHVHALCVCMSVCVLLVWACAYACVCMCVHTHGCKCGSMIPVALASLSARWGLEVFPCQCSGLCRSLLTAEYPTPVTGGMCFSPWLEFYLPVPWKRQVSSFLMTEERLPVRKDCVSQVDPGLLVAHRLAALPESERMFHENALEDLRFRLWPWAGLLCLSQQNRPVLCLVVRRLTSGESSWEGQKGFTSSTLSFADEQN